MACAMVIENSYRQTLGQGVEQAALFFGAFVHYSSEHLLRCVMTPIVAGRNGNWDSPTLEKVRRVVTVLIHSAMLLVSVPLALVGSLLDRVADLIKGTSFTHWKGTLPAKEEVGKQKLMTLNACMLWGGLPIPLGGLRPPRHRLDHLANLILQKDPDIVMLQEVSFGPGWGLYNRLKDDYTHFFTKIGPNAPMMESGLFVASKFPVLSEGWIPFPGQMGIYRGAFYIETEKGVYFTTHMEHGEEKRAMRAEQLALIEAKMETFEKPCYLLGDLNIQPEEYAGIQERFVDLRGVAPGELTPDTATCTDHLVSSMLGNPAPKKPYELVDFILMQKKKADRADGSVELISTFNIQFPYLAVTDHRGLVLTGTYR